MQVEIRQDLHFHMAEINSVPQGTPPRSVSPTRSNDPKISSLQQQSTQPYHPVWRSIAGSKLPAVSEGPPTSKLDYHSSPLVDADRLNLSEAPVPPTSDLD